MQADGRPFVGATIQAFDKDLRSEQALGRATTDAGGACQISYTPALFSRAENAWVNLDAYFAE